MTESSTAAAVTVVVVVYNGESTIGPCLEALLDDPGAQRIVVVDNASTDGGAAVAAAMADGEDRLALIRSDRNLGYAGGVNRALAGISTEYVAVINQDCVAEPGWLDSLAAYLDNNPGAAAANPLLLLKGDGRLNAAGLDVHVTGLGFNRLLHSDRETAGHRPQTVSGLQGTAFVIRRDILEEMGGWNEGGFLYHEDVEISWTLQLMGYRVGFVPGAVVWHDYYLTMSPEKLYLLERNRWAMLLANTRLATRLGLVPMLALTELGMWAYCLTRGRSFLTAKARSYRWIAANATQIRNRRAQVARLRQRSDWDVLRRLRWNYTWDQLWVLRRERGARGRRGGGSLPTA